MKRLNGIGLLFVVAAIALGAVVPVAQAAPFVVHRVNSGGPAVDPDWDADTDVAPSEFVNSGETNFTALTSFDVDLSHASVPSGTPEAIFDDERWDTFGSPANIKYAFPVTPGMTTVRLYFAETFFDGPGDRRFDVEIEGAKVLDDYDIAQEAGAVNKAIVETFTVVSNSTLDVEFSHANADNPLVKAIEVLSEPDANGIVATPGRLDFGGVPSGATRTRPITLANEGATSVTLDSTTITGVAAGHFSDDFPDAENVTLAPGAETTIEATFSPDAIGTRTATLTVAHNGARQPLRIQLRGVGQDGTSVAFEKSALAGETSSFPTALQWGPDGRLYVADFAGTIRAYSVAKDGPNDYRVSATETINLINTIPNHDDDGSVNATETARLITGLLVAGTAGSPVVYVSSSDPRIGGGDSALDSNLDTNSSMVSRLTKGGGGWQKLDLVRGLPRSEENHAANGLALDPDTNTLYLAQGGNTNKGAPSNNFAFLPEYAYGAAVLSIDLDAIGNTTHDLPTLDDQDKPNSAEALSDPFGGNDGKNQARIVAGSPVKVHAPGFRNPYGVAWTSDDKLFAIDNGGNAGWGTFPDADGPEGACTNATPALTGDSDYDALHHIPGSGYYGGHPNPTRANRANTFNSGNPQSPIPAGGANPIECDYRKSGSPASTGLTTWPSSTNGLDEYTASTFDGAMQGDLIVAGYVENKIFRIQRSADGTDVSSNTSLVSNAGTSPLDVDAIGDDGPFPGTIWVADQGGAGLLVLEPSTVPCEGDRSDTLDEDEDGFTNSDELDNGTNPCSGADRPADADGDQVSDLNDPDDDNDGRPDLTDPFQIDDANGTGTELPLDYQWENGQTPPGGLLGSYDLGFTGLMINGTSNYRDLFDTGAMTVVGAAGVLTLDAASPGDAAAGNNQTQAFQFGLDAGSAGGKPFEVRTRIVNPFADGPPTGRQSLGLYVGTGTQDDYVKVVAGARGGPVGIRADREVGGSLVEGSVAPLALPLAGSSTQAKAIDLSLVVDPVAHTVQAHYAVVASGAIGPRIEVGAPIAIPAAWLNNPAQGLAVGIISTARGAATSFTASWDFITAKLAPAAPVTTPTPIPTPSGGGQPSSGPAPGGTAPGPNRPAFAAARLAAGQRTARVRRGRTVRLAIACPRQVRSRCKGRVTLETAKRHRSRNGARRIRLAARAFSIRSGSNATLTLTLTAAGRRLFQRPRRITTRLNLRTTDARARSVLRRSTVVLVSRAVGKR